MSENRIAKAEALGLTTQEHYEQVLEEAAELRIEKVHGYGEDRYYITDARVAAWMSFSDIFRKYIRLRQLTKALNQALDSGYDQEIDHAAMALRENYKDILNYAAQGMQDMDRIVSGGSR